MDDDKPKILSDYTFIKDIGEGNFGKVKLSILNATNENFAIKILNKEKLKSQTKSSAYNEIEIISKLNHENIIHVEKILEDKDNYYIIMEYCDNGELFEYIVNNERLDQIESSIFFYQLINGVEYIHKQGFAHRDLKPENLLLTKNKILKIIDFGLCHDFDGKTLLKTKCGSPSYAAPEILKGLPYDGFKTDIWCCGIILYGMLCGYLPFDGDDNQETFKQIVECNPEYPSFLEEDSINLLIGILNPKPKNRLSICQIKKHPFYLRGKNHYLHEHEKDIIRECVKEEVKNNYGNYNSVEKKKYELSSIKKKNKEVNTFNNIKTLKVKNNKKYKNNIYQNIFTNIEIYDDNAHKENELKDKDIENEKYDKTQKRKINEIAALHNNIKNNEKKYETEGNEEKAILLTKFKDKIKNRKLKLNKNYFLKTNDDSLNNKLHIKNLHSNSNKKNNNNYISLDPNKFNAKSSDKTKQNRIFLKQEDNSIKSTLKVKRYKNNNELKLKIKNLDFFQKFLINRNNKNHYENSEKSPFKTKGINFNLILTKEKERNIINNKKEIKNEKEKENLLSIKKDKYFLKDKIIYTQNRKKLDSDSKQLILHSEINLVNSPHSNNKNQIKYKFDKYYGSVYGINNKNINEGCRTFSINKRNSKNMKLRKNLNLRIINLYNKENSVKKIMRNKYVKSYQNNRKENEEMKEIMNNKNLNNREEAFKTEPKYNHFLDKVINKIKYNKDIKKTINLHTLNDGFKNEDKKQVFKLLNFENNNEELLRHQYLIKYYKKNLNEVKSNKQTPLNLDENKKYFLSITPKIMEDNKENSRHKNKQIFTLVN